MYDTSMAIITIALGTLTRAPSCPVEADELLADQDRYARCFSSWPWQSLNCSHQQPTYPSAKGTQPSLSVGARSACKRMYHARRSAFTSVLLFYARRRKAEMSTPPMRLTRTHHSSPCLEGQGTPGSDVECSLSSKEGIVKRRKNIIICSNPALVTDQQLWVNPNLLQHPILSEY
jgi:hypothetical protein